MNRLRCLTGLVAILLVAGNCTAQRTSNSMSASTAEVYSMSIPHLIRFNGALKDLTGQPLTGPVDVTFSIYETEDDSAPLWWETQTVQADSGGHYAALLGAMNPAGVPMDLFTSGEAHWLGVQVSNLPEQPRVLLVSVPYAMKAGDAETLGGRPASAYQLAPVCRSDSNSAHCVSASDETSSSAGRTALRKVTTTSRKVMRRSPRPRKGTPLRPTVVTKLNFIPMFADNSGTLGNSVMYQDGLNIGVGTADPTMGGLTASRFTIMQADDRTAFAIGNSSGMPRFGLNPNSNGSWTLYDFAAGAWTPGITQMGGRVGIGTVSPGAALEVNGTAQFDGSINLVSVPVPQSSEVALGNAFLSGKGSGIILRSPDGSLCRLFSINNTGALVGTTIPCP